MCSGWMMLLFTPKSFEGCFRRTIGRPLEVFSCTLKDGVLHYEGEKGSFIILPVLAFVGIRGPQVLPLEDFWDMRESTDVRSAWILSKRAAWRETSADRDGGKQGNAQKWRKNKINYSEERYFMLENWKRRAQLGACKVHRNVPQEG